MKVSVILCTYNRSESLHRALDSVARSVLPESIQWEVLVVDNNSSDETRGVVQDFIGSYPGRFRYVFEPKTGKSHALNAGILQSDADALAFMDDDVVVEPLWLKNLLEPLSSGTWVGAGGRILMNWRSSPPKWLPKQERYGLAPLALFDLGPEAGPLHEPPFGTNMAFRRKVFDKYAGFRTDLGPRPGSEIRNEDTEFGQRLLDGGEQLWYQPSAVVYHSTSEERLQKSYFLRWWYDKARADVRQLGVATDTKWVVAGVPLYRFRPLAIWTLRWLSAVSASERFAAKLKVWSLLGAIREYYQLSHTTDA